MRRAGGTQGRGLGHQHRRGLQHRPYNLNGAAITSPSLNSPALGEAGEGAGYLGYMPGWDWDLTTPNAYTFNGAAVEGNPTISLTLGNHRDIGTLEVTRNNSFSNFAIAAPQSVPEPSSMAQLALGSGVLWISTRSPRGVHGRNG